MFCVGLVSSFMNQPGKSHVVAAKRILKYVKGTTDVRILFPFGTKKDELELMGYYDFDYGGDAIERKSTYGYVFFLNRAPISWCSKKQTIVALPKL